MAKSARRSRARHAGANAGNEAPGATEQGQNARRRSAQAAGAGRSDRGLTAEQEDMERQREEYGAAVRGTGDKPPEVHGRTRPVLTGHEVIPREYEQPSADGEDTAAPELPRRTIRVRALRLGYYNDRRRRPGDVFLIRAPYKWQTGDAESAGKVKTVDEFSPKWMEKVPGHVPLRTTSSPEAMQKANQAQLAAKRRGESATDSAATDAGVVDSDVLPA